MSAVRLQLLGERRAISLLFLGFYTCIFTLLGIAQGGAWTACFLALGATYGIAFFALAAEYFWARWFAMGLGTSGLTMAGLGLVTTGWNWGLVIWGTMHGLIYLPLLGATMAGCYDEKADWRQRYNLDEHGVARIKRAVTGAATALPTMIFYALAPRQDQQLLVLLAPLLVAVGCLGLIRLRFWGVVSLALAAVVGLGSVASAAFACCGTSPVLSGVGIVAVAALAFSIAPFFRPAARFLASPS